MLNVGIISAWHVHTNGYADEMIKSGKVCIKAIWDCDAQRGRKWAQERQIEFVEDYDAFISRSDFSAVICNSPTTMHPALLEKAISAGKDVFTEKLLATDADTCARLGRLIEEKGIVFTISLPLRCRPAFLFAKKLVDEGTLGKISAARMRRSHGGVSDRWLPDYWFDTAMTGGGAMMDLGAHAAYILAFLFGEPRRVTGMTSNLFGTSSDENAIALVEFEGGVIGTCETAFVTCGVPDILEIYGTEGALFVRGSKVELCTRADGKSPITEQVAPQSLPEALPSPILQFVDACIGRTGTPAHLGAGDALVMTRIIESMYTADRTGQTVRQ